MNKALLSPRFVWIHVIAALAIFHIGHSGAALPNLQLACDFFDSTNITGGHHHENGSIIFDDVEYPSDQYAVVNYVIQNEIERIPVEPHTRGCLCKIKKCIRLCCPRGEFYNETINECQKGADNPISQYNNINLDNETSKENIGFVYDQPCESNSQFEAQMYKILSVSSTQS